MTTPIQSAKGIPPSEYSAHVERVLARRTKRRLARWLFAILLAVIAALYL